MTTPNGKVARPHPHYTALCILPGGKIETKGQAELDGYTIEAPARPAPIVVTKPIPRPASVKRIAPAPSAAILAERARAREIMCLTPAGAEAEAVEAVRTGMSIEAFRGVLAGRAILSATCLARGG